MSTSTVGYLAALAGFHGMGPSRLRLLLQHHPPAEAFAVLSGQHPPSASIERMLSRDLRAAWRADAASRMPDDCEAACRSLGINAVAYGDPRYPSVLLDDPRPPAVLFVRGELGVVANRRVGVIGTRNPTRSGVDTATTLGAELGTAGVAVVSGLARGIDGAAHRGVLETGGIPIAVVGNGLDRAYPRLHRELWESVARSGVLLSEWPPATAPDAFRFPLRNRILAALSEVVVVVESRERGGSLSTVREADERGIEVMAVPGSPQVRSSAGTNELLCSGAAPVTCTDDILIALGLDTRRSGNRRHDSRPLPDASGAAVLALCRAGPVTLDEVVLRIGLSVAQAAMALARLERSGWIAESGGWFEVLGAWSAVASAGPAAGSTGEPR